MIVAVSSAALPVAPAHTRLVLGSLLIVVGGLLALDFKKISSKRLRGGRPESTVTGEPRGWPNWFRVVGRIFALVGVITLITVAVNP